MKTKLDKEFRKLLHTEVEKEFSSLRGHTELEINTFLDSYPKPLTSVCTCKKEMEKSGGFLYCPDCRVVKVLDIRQVFQNVEHTSHTTNSRKTEPSKH